MNPHLRRIMRGIWSALAILLLAAPAGAELVDGYLIRVQNIHMTDGYLQVKGRVSGGDPCSDMKILLHLTDKSGKLRSVRCRVNYDGGGRLFSGRAWIRDSPGGWEHVSTEIFGCRSGAEGAGIYTDDLQSVSAMNFAVSDLGEYIEILPVYYDESGGYVFWSGNVFRISFSVYENTGDPVSPVKGRLLESGGRSVQSAKDKIQIRKSPAVKQAPGLVVECSANPGRLVTSTTVLGAGGPRPDHAGTRAAGWSQPEKPDNVREWTDQDGVRHFTDVY